MELFPLLEYYADNVALLQKIIFTYALPAYSAVTY